MLGCRLCKAQKVGVNVVREMYGLLNAHQDAGAIVITSGMFTLEANAFADGKPLDLVEGQQLVAMIDTVKGSNLPRKEPVSSPISTAQAEPICPVCGSRMVLRKSKKGSNGGQQFWGCPKFPSCRGTKPC